MHNSNDDTIRSLIWVNTKISTNNWKSLHIPDSPDLSAIQLNDNYGKLTIINIYNDGDHDNTLNKLNQYMETHRNTINTCTTDRLLLAGDFNRHHPLWHRDEDKPSSRERPPEKLTI